MTVIVSPSRIDASDQPELIACGDCGLLQALPPPPPDRIAECRRCCRDLWRPKGSFGAPFAWSITALLLLLPALLAPLMHLTSFGIERIERLPTGVQALSSSGDVLLAALVLGFSIVIPCTYLGLLVIVLGSLELGRAPLGRLFRWANHLRPWAMVEVYLVGCCVAYSRLQDIGSIGVGLGGWYLMAATLAVLFAILSLDERQVWRALPPEAAGPAPLGAFIDCHACGLVLEARFEHSRCPRCAMVLRRRKPAAMQRTLALVIAGFILYVPANVLPVLSIVRFGHAQPSTILSGVRQLLSADLWPLAIIVFTASIVVPLVKLCSLTLMLALTRRRSRRWLLGRTRLYRFIEAIGRWSSIDLFMISILVALVRFGNLTSIYAAAGATAFAAVVVVTMLASRAFDPRLMWDALDEPA